MFDYHLFLAFLPDPEYLEKLHSVPSQLRAFLIQDHDKNYLMSIEHEGKLFLAKNLGPLVDLQSLESAQSHIYSVLKRLVPNFAYSSHPLILLSLPVDQ